MIRRIVAGLALVAVLTVVLYTGRTLAPPSAEATLPPGPCPAAPGVGTVTYNVTATLPAGPAANGVCITLIGTGGTNNSGVVFLNPPGCPAPAAGAGTSDVWADWGLAGCVDPGESVTIRFKNGGTLAPGVQPGAAVWNLVGGGTVAGAVTVTVVAVGGVAEAPVLDELAAAESTSGGIGILPYAGGGAAVALLLAAGLTGIWYAGRRNRA